MDAWRSMRVRDLRWNPPLRTLRLSGDLPFLQWTHNIKRDRLGCIPVRTPDGRSGMFLARWNSARPCTAWVRERRARVSRRASSQEQGSEVRVPAPPGCASVARACRAAPHHINNRDAACCVPVVISLAAGCGERVTYCRRSWCTRLRSPCSTHRWPRGTPSTPRRFP